MEAHLLSMIKGNSAMPKTVTIVAITGAQQNAIARRFSEAGWLVRGTSRRAAATPFGPTIIADPDTGEGLAAAFDRSDVVVLTLPQDHRSGAMERIAANVARAADAARVGRLVLNLAGTIAEDSDEPLFNAMRAARNAVRSGAVPWVILQPTVFMDNMLAPWVLPAIAAQGLLASPAPEEALISYISHRSLAAYVLAVATHPDAVGHDLRIGGPEALSGTQLCERLGKRLGRALLYQAIPLDAFAAGLDQAFGAPAGQRIASAYVRLSTDPTAMAVDPASVAFLSVEAESFSTFAARHEWSMSTGTEGHASEPAH